MTKKKIFLTVGIFLFAVLLAVGIFFVSKMSSLPTENNPVEENEKREIIYSDEASSFVKTTVENENGKFTLVKADGEIRIEGKENIPLLPATSEDLFKTLSAVYSTEKVSDKKDGFGFENPKCKITTEKTDGTVISLLLGDKVPSGDGKYYMSVGNSDNVYLLDKERAEIYLSPITVLYSKTVSKYFPTENLLSYYIKDGEKEIYLRALEDGEKGSLSFLSDFAVEKPFFFGASGETVTSLTETLSLFPDATVVCEALSSDVFEKYGISDNIKVEYTAKFDTTSLTTENGNVNPYYDRNNKDGFVIKKTVYKIGKTENNETYFTYDDLPIIYSVPKTAFDFMKTDVYLYYQRLISIAYLTDLSSLSVDDKTFEITVKTLENGEKEVEKVTCDYKNIDVENFKNFYLNLISVSHVGISEKPENGKCVLSVDYKFADTKTATSLRFLALPDDDRKTFLEVSGGGHFTVLMTKVDKIKSDLEKLFTGEEIITE